MAIILRQNTATNTGKGSKLTFAEMDSNLESFFYSSSLSGNILTLFTTGSVSHSINLNSIAGSVNTGSLLLTASYSGQVITFTKADNSTFALNLGDVVVELESGSLLKSSSFANGTMSFTKGDGTSYSLNLNSISASSLATASYSNQIVTFTKGDGTTFNVDLNEFVTQTESGSLLASGSYNSSTNVLTFTKGNGTTFDVNLTSTGDAKIAVTDTSTNQNYYVTFVSGTAGEQDLRVDSSAIVYNPSTNTLQTENLILTGDLTVQGTRTELQVTDLRVEDKLITVASGSANSAAADGAGIEVAGANQSITWDSANSRFKTSTNLAVSGSLNVASFATDEALSDFVVIAPDGTLKKRTSGAQGIQGTQGTQGITGAQGTQGTQGITGTQGTQGIQGITGAQGIQGTNGSQGIQGITGAQGTDGTQGSQGVQGVQGTTGTGTQGIQGVQGTTGTGTQGIQGITGTQGTQGTTGTATQGIQGIQGITGTQGTTGTGTQGIQGITGTQGTDGAQGIQGIQGITGSQGTTGTGTQGIQGITGAQGTQGTNGINGTQGVQGVQGITGNDSTIPGPQGTQGVQGVQGIAGTASAQGAQGIQGIQGITGTGTQGIQGITGTQGTNGTQGIQGITGTQGTDGTQGIQGIQGITGTGIQGAQGTNGTQGIQGIQGIQGTTGTGTQGIQGITGIQGTQGIQGPSSTNAVTIDVTTTDANAAYRPLLIDEAGTTNETIYVDSNGGLLFTPQTDTLKVAGPLYAGLSAYTPSTTTYLSIHNTSTEEIQYASTATYISNGFNPSGSGAASNNEWVDSVDGFSMDSLYYNGRFQSYIPYFTNRTILTFPQTQFAAVWIEYTVSTQDYATMRTQTFVAHWNDASTIQYTNIGPLDIGTVPTTNTELTATLSGGNALIQIDQRITGGADAIIFGTYRAIEKPVTA